MRYLIVAIVAIAALRAPALAEETVRIGLNYPKTGPYAAQGIDQRHAAEMAIEEINADGGILGRQVELAWRDSESRSEISTANVAELIDSEGCRMIFGGSASSVAIAAGNVCQEKGVPFFGTLTYSTATTGKEARRHVFRECYNARSAAKALADYMNTAFAGRTYAYITADYSWGHETEGLLRKFTNTSDTKSHKGLKLCFPGATDDDYKLVMTWAKATKPDVLVLVMFGENMQCAVRQATAMGLKDEMEIVVPNLTLGMAAGSGPKVMEGVIGAVPWCWNVPAKYGYERGQAFVDGFARRYERYPSSSGALAYTIVHEYKSAVERAGSFDAPGVILALEGHGYTLLKDEQQWRAFDHQSVQTVYTVRCKPLKAVTADRYKLDYFEILSSIGGDEAFRSRSEWNVLRTAAGKPTHLEPLEGESVVAGAD